MVQQQASNLKMSASTVEITDEVQEFHLVHAIITQHQQQQQQQSIDEFSSKDIVKFERSMLDEMSTICQKFHVNTIARVSNRKRVVPTYIKHLQKRSLRKCENKRASNHDDDDDDHGGASSNQLHLEAYRKNNDVGRSEESASQQHFISVQQKVEHFERRCAQTTYNHNPHPSTPPRSSSRNVSRNHPDGLVVEEVNNQVGEEQNHHHQDEDVHQQQHGRLQPHESDDVDDDDDDDDVEGSGVQLTGRNLKRVPSERFRQMRQKVQRLMQRRADDDDDDDDVSNTSHLHEDEASFLKSIRVPLLHNPDPCVMLRLPDHALCDIFRLLDTRTLAALKSSCSDFNYLVNFYDIRGTDSMWTKDKRYMDDPCKQCRRHFTPGDQSLCRYHPKRYYADLPYGRSYWMCCLKSERRATGCKLALHDNNWLAPQLTQTTDQHANT